MTLSELKDIMSIIQSTVHIMAFLAAGIWAYVKFVLRREKEPRAEFDVDLKFVGVQDEFWLVEVSAFVENKGQVRHPVNNFSVRLRYLLHGDKVEDGLENIGYQLKLPHTIDERIENKKRYFWSKDEYIDPGSKHRNSYITALPVEATFVLAMSKFHYKNRVFPIQKLFRVPERE
jgi:hypothetical protein